MEKSKSTAIHNRGKRLIGNSLVTASSSVLNQILMFLTLPMLLNAVGTVEYGIYSLATAAVGYFSVLSIAARSSVVKFTAELRQGDYQEINRFFSSAMFMNVCLGFLVGGIVLICGIFCEALFKIPPEHVYTAKYLFFMHAAATFLLQPLSVFTSLIYGLQQFQIIAALDAFWAICAFACHRGDLFFRRIDYLACMGRDYIPVIEISLSVQTSSSKTTRVGVQP